MARFIHQSPSWPTLHWDAGSVVSLLSNVRHKQGLLLGRMGTLGFNVQTDTSLEMLTAEVVKTSAIEGETLNPEEVRSSIARKLGLEIAGLRKSSRNVDGVVEMMVDATTNFEAALSAERLFAWHASLFPTGRSGMTRIDVGQWRTKEAGPMQVVSGPIGKEKVHFKAPDADRLDVEMEKFLDWFNSPLMSDPVLKAGVAHFWFVTVHPFEDGNGRIARAIADMALARADGVSQRFYSMSTQIEAERKSYYQQLEHSQRGDVNITRWLSWFLECLERALDSADFNLAAVLQKANLWMRINRAPVNERQRTVINRMLENWEGFLTTSKYAKIAKCSPDTALRDIRELLDRHILTANPARGRSTSYRLSEPDDVTT